MTRIALVVGIDNYQNYDPLTSAAQGAVAIAQHLDRDGKFQVKVFPDPSQASITLRELESQLIQLFKPKTGVIPETVLFYFAGYGLIKNGGVQEGFLATSDINLDRSLYGLSLFWLQRLLRDSPVPQWGIWLDCYGFGAIGKVQGDYPVALDFAESDPGEKSGYSRFFLATSQASPEGRSELGYSLLTQAILEGLDPYRSENGVVTSAFLVNWVRTALEDQVHQAYFTESGNPIVLTRTADEICPYKGLAYFDCNTEDPRYFYGREALTEHLLGAVQHRNFLAVLGPAGSGKSSVLRAGLVHHLQQGRKLPGSDRWHIRILQPGGHPLLNLAFAFLDLSLPLVERAKQLGEIETLLTQGATGMRRLVQASAAERVVLIVDQFEEIFTLCRDRAEREIFLDCLLGTLEQAAEGRYAVPLQILIGMRSDFFSKCVKPEYVRLGQAIRNNRVQIPPLTPEELRQAIAEPARQVGVTVEPELIQQMIIDVAGSPGGLPLLEYTLTELWKQRTANRLQTNNYVRLGGIRGTLQQRANAVYGHMTPEQQAAAKHIFLSLTQFGDGVTEDSRRRVFKRDLATPQFPPLLIDTVIQRLADEKLVVTSDWAPPGTGLGEEIVVDVIHEALIRHWERLRQWIDDNRDLLRQHRELQEQAELWFRKGRLSDYLIQGEALSEALVFWQRNNEDGLPGSGLVKEFLEACQQEDTLRRATQVQQKRSLKEQQQKIQNALQRTWTIALTAGTTLAGALLLIALQLRAAELQSIRSLQPVVASDLADAQEIDARVASVQAAQQLRSSLWHRLFPEPLLQQQVMEGLQQTLYGVREFNYLIGHEAGVVSVDVSPDGSTIVTCGRDGKVKLWDLQGNVLTDFEGHQGVVYEAAFSPDGLKVATAGRDGTIRLWNLNGRELLNIQGRDGAIFDLAFSPDGSQLVSSGEDGIVRRWDLEGKLLGTFKAHSGWVYDVSFSPNSKTLATAGGDGLARLWSLDGKKLKEFQSPGTSVWSLAFSPDGSQLATSSGDGTVSVWQVSPTQANPSDLVLTLTMPRENLSTTDSQRVLAVTFSPNGQELVTSGTDGIARLWDRQGNLRGEFRGHGDWVYDVAFSPKGDYLVTGGRDGTARLWNLDPHPALDVTADADRVLSVAYSPVATSRNGTIATSGTDGTIQLWSADGTPLTTLKGHRGWVLTVTFSPNGQVIASSGTDGTVRFWKLNGQPLQTLSTGQNWVYEIIYSPDGSKFATRGRDGTVQLWSLAGEKLATFTGHQGEVYGIQFSPDGTKLATRGRDSTVRIWDMDGEPLAGLRDHQGEIYDIAFTPDSSLVATAGADGTVRLWDLNGQPLTVLRGHTAEVYSVSIDANNFLVATSSADGTARLWNLNGNSIATLKGQDGPVWEARFSPDGTKVATRQNDGTVQLWNLEGQRLATLQGHEAAVWSFQFSPDSNRLVTSSADGNTRLWDLQGKLLNTLGEHPGEVYSVAVDPQGKLFATSGSDGIARLWDTQGKLIAELKGHQSPVWQVIFSPDGKELVTGGADGTARIWNRQGEQQAELAGHLGQVYSVAFRPDGSELATGSEDGTVRRWRKDGTPISEFKASDRAIYTVVYSNKGSKLATSGADATARVWSLGGKSLVELNGHQETIYSVAFSPDDSELATSSADGTARLWTMEGDRLTDLRGHTGEVWHINFSPDGQQLVTSGADGTTRLWNHQGEQTAIIPSHFGGVHDSRFTKDGSALVSGGVDGQMRVWLAGDLVQLLAKNCDRLQNYLNNPQVPASDKPLCSAVVDR
jgi:WD40 repeat protein